MVPSTFYVRGVSYRQPVLRRIAGWLEPLASSEVTARLVLESDNKHDPNAVRVEVLLGDDTVSPGYLPAELCQPFRAMIYSVNDTVVEWPAEIVSIGCDGEQLFMEVSVELPDFLPHQSSTKTRSRNGTSCSPAATNAR